MFSAYVTNLGLYPERGVEVGEYLEFPTTAEDVQALFARIGIDGIRYEEYFITDYESDVLGLYDHLGEYESLDELNYLAHLLDEMGPDELAKFEAAMDAGEYTGSVKDLINLAQNLDCYEFYPDVNNEDDLGRLYIQDFEAIEVPEHLIDYIDYEAYGRDMRINEGEHFAPRWLCGKQLQYLYRTLHRAAGHSPRIPHFRRSEPGREGGNPLHIRNYQTIP